ncbi:glycosyl hydrolase [Chitinophaga vietnamensis]|uniref:glycosyl hydrolase n=1 Tax=Chitinophaga vietnamensis TaxID=2593957 RepID=UPI0011782676|nr:glycosyl hydrolase [Chitinophaga vietnamensis]
MNKKTLLAILISLPLLQCSKEAAPASAQASNKQQWIKDYFQALSSSNYPGIHAVSWWQENFDGSLLAVNSSEAALQQYQAEVSSPLFSEQCSFTNGKLSIPSDKRYHAAFPNFGGTEDQVSASGIADFEALARKKIAWAYFSNNWLNGITFPQKEVDIIRNAGKIPFIRMMPRSRFEAGKPDPQWHLIDIIHGQHDTALKAWATAAKNYGAPLLVEFGAEVNGSWFPWNGAYNGGGTLDGYGDPKYPDGPEIYRDAFRHIIDLFRQAQVNNITWFFHIDAAGSPEDWWNDAPYYYPGDDYIDWIGISTYGPQKKTDSYTSPKDLLDKAYRLLQSVSAQKPYAIVEVGVTEW